MKEELSASAGILLILFGLMADGIKFALDWLFGIGLILDPVFITPIFTLIFWIILNHNGIRMFSGQGWKAAWVNELVSLTPGVDILPDWTSYAIYLNAKHGNYGGVL